MLPAAIVLAQLSLVAPVSAVRDSVRAVPAAIQAVEPLGRARVLIPAMAVAYVGVRAVDGDDGSRPIARTAVGYFAADAVGGFLKLAVGRHRPDSTGNAWRFAPFRRGREWHSFPSGHTYHAFSIASAISDETDDDVADFVAYGVATMVGVQRVLSRAHWTSDVIAGAALGIAVSRHARRRIGPRDREPQSRAVAVRLGVAF